MAKKPSQLGIAVMPSQLWLLLLTVLCHLSPERQVTRHGKYYFEFLFSIFESEEENKTKENKRIRNLKLARLFYFPFSIFLLLFSIFESEEEKKTKD